MKKKWQVEKLANTEQMCWRFLNLSSVIFLCIARGQDEKAVIWFETLLEDTPEKEDPSCTQTCYGVWNSTVRDSLVWVFQSFQLKYKNFWKGLHLILLKLSDHFPGLRSWGKALKNGATRGSLENSNKDSGPRRESGQAPNNNKYLHVSSIS